MEMSTLDTLILAGKKFHTFTFIRQLSSFYFSYFGFPPLLHIYINTVKLAAFKISQLNQQKQQKQRKLVLMNTFCVQGIANIYRLTHVTKYRECIYQTPISVISHIISCMECQQGQNKRVKKLKHFVLIFTQKFHSKLVN